MHSQSAIFDEFLVTLKVFFKIKGACNASNDAISVVSLLQLAMAVGEEVSKQI